MLQVPFIRENTDLVITKLSKRNLDARPMIDKVLDLDEQRRSAQAKLDSVLAQSNTISKEIGLLFKSGKAEEANQLKLQTTALKEESKQLGETLNRVTHELGEILHNIPNVPHDLVPEGATEDDNVEVFRAGEVPELGEEALPHWELAKFYDIIDFELGNKITGAGFPVYKGQENN